LEQAYKYGKKLYRILGWRGLFGIITTLSWFFFPFLLWYQLYLWVGQSFPLFGWAFLGIVVVLVSIALSSFFSVKLILLRTKMAKHVENAKRMFDDPANPTSEENFHRECGKFIIPYLHYPHVYVLGFAGSVKRQQLWSKIVIRSFQLFLHFFPSYLTIVFLINSQSNLNQASVLFSSILRWSPQLLGMLTVLHQNLILLVVTSFFFSSYFSIQITRVFSPFPGYVFDVITDCFSVFNRLTFLGTLVVSSPWVIRERTSTLVFSPFTFQPMTVKEVMQRSVENIEQTECQVTVWQYEVNNTSDVRDLKRMIFESTDIPSLVRDFCLEASDEEMLKTVNESKPVLYLGTIDKRCSIIGRVIYDAKARIYRATFAFDNHYVRDMFRSIAKIQIETQKKLSSKLPYRMIRLMQNLKVAVEDEQPRD
jgi:hypothetical protein